MNARTARAGLLSDKIATCIAGEKVSVDIEYVVIDHFWITIRCKSELDAHRVRYAYRAQFSKIEKSADGETFLVVVEKRRGPNGGMIKM